MQRNKGKHRMGKIRDLFKKIRDTKGIFHAKMGSIKDRNGMDLTEGEDIEKILRKDGKNTQKIFFVQFFCVFLPPLLNIFCFC